MKRVKVSIIAALLAFAMVISSFGSITAKATGKEISRVFEGQGFNVTCKVNIQNKNILKGTMIITNTGDKSIENWSLLFPYKDDIASVSHAQIREHSNSYYIISNLPNNQDIAPDKSVEFNFVSKYGSEIVLPENYYIVTSEQEVDESDFRYEYSIQNHSGYKDAVKITITNTSNKTIEDWKVAINCPYSINQVWKGQIVSKVDNTYIISNEGNNSDIKPGNSVSFWLKTEEVLGGMWTHELYLKQMYICSFADLGIPNTKTFTDKLGQEYDITWVSDETRQPTVSQYTYMSIDEIINTDLRYSVSDLGMICFDMPKLNSYALVSTSFEEEPDLVLSVNLEDKTVQWLPFSTEENITTFYIDQSSIIIPAKYVDGTTETVQKDSSILSKSHNLLSNAAKYVSDLFCTTAYAALSDDDMKMFNILSNDNCKIKVELTYLKANAKEKWDMEELYVTIKEGSDKKTINLDDSYTFTYEAKGSGIININVLEEDLLFDDDIWEQNVYVQKDYSLSNSEVDELLEDYAPIVVYNNGENYAPMNLDDIFDQIPNAMSEDTMTFKTVFGKNKVNLSSLSTFMAYNGNKDYVLNFNNSLVNTGANSFEDIDGNFNDATVYKCFQEDVDNYYLTYYFIYGFDEKNSFGITGLANHNLDRESMTVVLNKDKEPVSILTGGHLDSTNIKYKDGSKTVFSWKHERVSTDYDQCITNYSKGHPIVYVENGAHCIYPVAGNYNVGIDAIAGLITNILNPDGSFIESEINALLPDNFETIDNARKYSLETLEIDEMYRNNVLNFSGYWVDVLGTTNAYFPPFLSRDYDKTSWYKNATKFDTTAVTLSNISMRTKEQLGNAYLFSLSSVENFDCEYNNDQLKLTWDSIDGIDGYILTRICDGTEEKLSINSNSNYYIDTNIDVNSTYSYKIQAKYKVDTASYNGSGNYTIYNNEAVIDNIDLSREKGTIVIRIKDADTNETLTGVKVYVDNKLAATSTSETTSINVSANQNHVIKTVKEGYNNVTYNELLVNAGETLSLETLMQVPYDANNPNGNATILIKNSQSGYALSNIPVTIRKGMNTTTGEEIVETTSNSSGNIVLGNLPSGNYTGTVDCEGYIKTVFNFVVIGGKTKYYEIHISPTLSNDQISIVLSWGPNPRDLDSHYSGSGLHVYYASKTAPGVELDVDDTSGYGPETITTDLNKLPKGVYQYYIHLYAGTGTIADSGATVKVYSGNTLIKTYYANQSTISGRYWYVFSIDTNSGVITDN